MGESYTGSGRSHPGAVCSDTFGPVSGLYVHIPYCARKCRYCAFHSIPIDACSRREPYSIVDTILRHGTETAAIAATARSVYVGGGTPSVLTTKLLGHLIDGLSTLAPHAQEFTVEANPTSLTAETLDLLASCGVTRLSVGIQTLDAGLADVLGRALTDESVVRMIRSRWNGSLSADLLFAVTADTLWQTERDVATLAGLGFDHLSIYELGVEPGTPLAASGHPPGSSYADRDAAWTDLLGTLSRAGFVRYEVASFTTEGHRCVHNLAYWHGDDYLGLGPSAVSTLHAGTDVVRIAQPESHQRFAANDSFFDGNVEHVDRPALILERFMVSLRTVDGLDRGRFRSDFGVDAVELVPATLARATDQHLLSVTDTAVQPTAEGIDLLDRILVGVANELAATYRSDERPES